MPGNSKEAYNSLKTLTKTQQHKSPVIKTSCGNILMESTTVLNQSSEYYSGLCNHKLYPDNSLLQSNEAVLNLKAGKSPGMDNIPSVLINT